MTGWIIKILIVLIILRLVLRFVMGLVQGLAPEGQQRKGARAVPLVRDPVCGTYIPRNRALAAGSGDDQRFFCSEDCRRAWSARAREQRAAGAAGPDGGAWRG